MKVLLWLTLTVIVTVQHTQQTKRKSATRKWIEECRAQSGFTRGEINSSDDTSVKIKEHTLCFMKKAGLVDDSGVIIMEKFRRMVKKNVADEKQVDKIVKDCVTVPKTSPEEDLFETFKCLREHVPRLSPPSLI